MKSCVALINTILAEHDYLPVVLLIAFPTGWLAFLWGYKKWDRLFAALCSSVLCAVLLLWMPTLQSASKMDGFFEEMFFFFWLPCFELDNYALFFLFFLTHLIAAYSGLALRYIRDMWMRQRRPQITVC